MITRLSQKWAWHFLVSCNRVGVPHVDCNSVNLLHICKATMAKRGFKSSVVVQPKLRVLLDMDQVLAEFEGHFLTKYKETYPNDPFIPSEKRNTFYLRDQYAKLRPDLPDKVRAIYIAENFFLELPPIPGSLEAAAEIAKMENVDVFICTSPLTDYRHCLHEKCRWVETHLGAEWVDRVIITKDKTMVNGHVLIDDRPYIKGACPKPTWEHIVFTANHNTKTDIRGKRRLDNWTDGSWRDVIEDCMKKI